MKFFKVFALGLLSLLLFIFLTAFGVSLTARQTALNPHFVNGVINKVDFSEAVREILAQQSKGTNPPSQALIDALVSSVSQSQSDIKQRLNIAVNDTYDYMLGKTSEPDIRGTLRKTFFNSEFVNSAIQNVDISQLINQFFEDQITPGNAETKDLINSIVSTINQTEPAIKTGIGAASDPVFQYVLSDSNTIDLKAGLRTNILNKAFVVQVINSIDISVLISDPVKQQLNTALPQGITLSSADVDKIINILQPVVKQGLAASADEIADYIVGIRPEFSVDISAATPSIKPIVKQAFVDQLPSYLSAGASQAQIDQAFEIYWIDAQNYLPSKYIIDSSIMGNDFQSSINSGLNSAQKSLTDFRDGISDAQNKLVDSTREPREIIHIFQLVYIGLIMVILLAIGGIVLIQRSVRGASRDLGITFSCYGVIGLIGTFIFQGIVGSTSFIQRIVSPDTPKFAVDLIHTMAQKITQPLFIFTLIILIIGTALLVLSFIYPGNRDTKPEKANPSER